MHSYRKGYIAENSLVHELYNRGWAVIRAPRSGRIGIPSPDIVAIKDGRVVVVECKSREDGFLVEREQLNQLKDWEARSKAVAYIGWKISRRGWFFFKLSDVVARNGRIGKCDIEKAVGIDDL